MSEIDTGPVDHFSPRQLKALLALARGRSRGRDYLPSACASRADLVRHLSALCPHEPQSGETVLAAVCARDTPLGALEGIKELAKSLVAAAASNEQRAAATLLYHGAVAAALGHHGRNISSRSVHARYELYEDLATLLDGDSLGQVFQDAAEQLSANPPSGDAA